MTRAAHDFQILHGGAAPWVVPARVIIALSVVAWATFASAILVVTCGVMAALTALVGPPF
jgi:hypothetical protein